MTPRPSSTRDTTTAKSTRSLPSGKAKPAKPHPDDPLTPHPSGRWCKKVRGQLHDFGSWRDPDGALEEWLRVKHDLLAGRKPRPKRADGGPTVNFVVDSFLTQKERKRDVGEIQPRTFSEFFAEAVIVADCSTVATATGNGSRPRNT